MNVQRYEPFADSRNIFDSFFGDDPLRGFFVRPVRANEVSQPAARLRVDVTDQDGAYQLTADLPGVNKDDIAVTVDGDVLTISAETKTSNERKDGDRVLFRERSAGKWSRSFRLGSEINLGEAQAKYENGVLALTLPKKAAESVKRLTVQ